MKGICHVFFIIFFCTTSLKAEVTIPDLSSPVTDTTDTLSADQVSNLSEKLRAFASDKGSQIALLIIATTTPETIEQYSLRVVDQWKLGRKKIDDGVLLIVAKQDRTLRIEVGYGLEGSLSDLVSKRIIDQIIVPHFKQGAFFDGINAGLDAIVAVVSGETLPAPTLSSQDTDSFLIFPLILIVVIGSFLKTLIDKRLVAGLSGIAAFVVATFFLTSFIAFLIGLLVAIVVLIGTLGGGSGRGGGFMSSRGGSGSSSYSGGGGSFGGGGASGRW